MVISHQKNNIKMALRTFLGDQHCLALLQTGFGTTSITACHGKVMHGLCCAVQSNCSNLNAPPTRHFPFLPPFFKLWALYQIDRRDKSILFKIWSVRHARLRKAQEEHFRRRDVELTVGYLPKKEPNKYYMWAEFEVERCKEERGKQTEE